MSATQESTRLRSSLSNCHSSQESAQHKLQQLEREVLDLRPRNQELLFELGNLKKQLDLCLKQKEALEEAREKALSDMAAARERSLREGQAEARSIKL